MSDENNNNSNGLRLSDYFENPELWPENEADWTTEQVRIAHYATLLDNRNKNYEAEGGDSLKSKLNQFNLKHRYKDAEQDFSAPSSFYKLLSDWMEETTQRHQHYSATMIHSRMWQDNDDFLKEAAYQIRDLGERQQALKVLQHAREMDEQQQVLNFTLWNFGNTGSDQERIHRDKYLRTMTDNGVVDALSNARAESIEHEYDYSR